MFRVKFSQLGNFVPMGNCRFISYESLLHLSCIFDFSVDSFKLRVRVFLIPKKSSSSSCLVLVYYVEKVEV